MTSLKDKLLNIHNRLGSLTLALSLLSSTAGAADKPKEKATDTTSFQSIFSERRRSESQQKRQRTNTSVMGIRGLDSDRDAEAKALAASNMRAVYEMEDRIANPDTVEQIKKSLASHKPNSTGTQVIPVVENTKASDEELRGEIELGRKMAAQVLGANAPWENSAVQDYLNALAQVIASSGMKATRPFRVAILETNKVNAFACPGGYLFLTRGALKAARSEDQLAALLGHEIAHVSQRHLLTSMQKKFNKPETPKKSQAYVSPVNDSLESRKRIKPERQEANSQWASILGPKGVGLTLLQASSEALETLLSKGLDHKFELEADTMGVQASAATGFRAESFADFLNLMIARKSNTNDVTSTTHPPYSERLQNLSRFLENINIAKNATEINSQLFLKMQGEWLR